MLEDFSRGYIAICWIPSIYLRYYTHFRECHNVDLLDSSKHTHLRYLDIEFIVHEVTDCLPKVGR